MSELCNSFIFSCAIKFIYFQLCKFAQEWADTLAKQDRFEHRPDQKYGENIYCTWSSDPKAKVSQKNNNHNLNTGLIQNGV